MKAIRIIEAALCADQLLHTLPLPSRSGGYLLLAVWNLPFLVFSDGDGINRQLAALRFLYRGATFCNRWLLGKANWPGGFQERRGAGKGKRLGNPIAHLSNALSIAFRRGRSGAGEIPGISAISRQ